MNRIIDIKKFKKKLILVYISTVLLGLVIIELHNVFIENISWQRILKYNVPFVAGQALLTAISYYIYTVLRLRKSFSMIKKNPEELSAEQKTEIYLSLARFPLAMFRFSTLFMVFLCISFHVYKELMFPRPFTNKHLLGLLDSVLHELSIAMILTMTVYSFLKHLFRPILKEMNQEGLVENVRFTYYGQVILVTLSVLFIIMSNYISLFVTQVAGSGNLTVGKLLIVSCFLILLTLFFVRMTLIEPLENIKEVSTQLQGLQSKERTGIHSTLPVTSLDEVGELVSSYNQVQSRIKGIYHDIEEELKLAYNVQFGLLPQRKVSFAPFEMEALFKPVKDVGGDFYDFIQIDEHKWGILVGDVSGKGLPSALLMSMMVGLIRGKIHQQTYTPAHLLQEINQLLHSVLPEGVYIAAGFGILDIDKNQFTYSSAGHVSPVVKIKDDVQFLEQSSLPLGIDPEAVYTDSHLSLAEVETILFYTDGMIEQVNQEGEFFGFQRLLEQVRNIGGHGLQRLKTQWEQFSAHEPQMDDITLVQVTQRF